MANAAASSPTHRTDRASAARPLPDDRPSIAVMPFGAPGSDADDRTLSDGIAEDVITELSRFREVMVISRSSSFGCEPFARDVRRVAETLGARYVLEGSVRRAGNNLRITGQLIDSRNEDQIWADRFDETMDDILRMQAEIAARIVASVVPEIHHAEEHRAERLPMGSVAAYELALKAGALLSRGVAAADSYLLSDGIRFAQEAINLDPLCLRAHYALAWGYCRRGALGYAGSTGAAIRPTPYWGTSTCAGCGTATRWPT